MRGHGYVQDQEKMARVWIARRKLQDHWAEVMTEDPILQLHYESMVNNQTLETKGFWTFLIWISMRIAFVSMNRTPLLPRSAASKFNNRCTTHQPGDGNVTKSICRS